jgi:hypothetical protein
MVTTFDEAVTALYRAPLDQFVAERKRLSSELKAGGDKEGAKRLAGLVRPPVSAWTVNQLFWEARETFDELFAAGHRLRAGDLGATNAHREAMAKLRNRAEAVLGAAGHAATEATLRRITTDLSALAAVGTFDPDPPGALAGDREPPGFDTIDMTAADVAPRAGAPAHDAARERDAGREREERERLERERQKEEAERARKRAQREKLETALNRAKADLEMQTQQVDRLRNELAKAEQTVARTQGDVAELESRLGSLE